MGIYSVDANHDELLSAKELAAAYATEGLDGNATFAAWQNQVEAWDADRDGFLSFDEASRALYEWSIGAGYPSDDETEEVQRMSNESIAADSRLPTAPQTVDSDQADLHARLRGRAQPQAEARTSILDVSTQAKVKDARCEGKPDGWLCLSATRIMYCSAGKRLREERSCGFEGKCKPGVLGTGGCSYPLCFGRSSGTYCHGSVVYGCKQKNANGASERHSIVHRHCRHSHCADFHDGPPPSRRRRTISCRTEYHGYRSHRDCWEDPQPPPFATCV